MAKPVTAGAKPRARKPARVVRERKESRKKAPPSFETRRSRGAPQDEGKGLAARPPQDEGGKRAARACRGGNDKDRGNG